MWSGRGNFAIPVAAVIAFAAMLGWFGWSRLKPDSVPGTAPDMVARAPSAKAPDPAAAPSAAQVAPTSPAPGMQAAAPADRPAPNAGAPAPQAATPPAGAGAGAPVVVPGSAAPAPAPSFDIVRVEPGGDTVIAGRAAPRGRVTLLDNGREIAALAADESGQFVILPPPLAPGSHELVLQVEGQDAAAATSPQSVTVVVAEARNQAPLVTLTAPGQPSVILSRPDAAIPATVAARPQAIPQGPGSPVAPGGPATAGVEASGAGAPPRIVSIESEGAGRLYVSGTVAPSASVRLYLNDAFVAAAAAGPDGRLAFAIESGVRPGDYRVRLDVVDGATGAVRSRAEAPFAMPAPVGSAGTSMPPLPPPAPGRTTTVASAPAASLPAPASAAPPARAGTGSASSQATPTPNGAPTPDAAAALPAGRAREASGDPAAPSPGARTTQPATPPAVAAAGTPLPGAPAPLSTDLAPPSSSGGPTSAAAGRAADASLATPRVTIVPEVNTAIVARGESLWQISKRTYGSGLRYTVIFGANTPQIRDPDLIYPGQVFVLPTGQPITVTR